MSSSFYTLLDILLKKQLASLVTNEQLRIASIEFTVKREKALVTGLYVEILFRPTGITPILHVEIPSAIVEKEV
jgi:hypothetical protein